jgi:hypothetical protein
MNLDRLDNDGSPFTFVLHGRSRTTRNPNELLWQEILAALSNPSVFLGLVVEDSQLRIVRWKLQALVDAWRDHHDLPGTRECHRLIYLLERYGDAIERDLFDRSGDLTDLWTSRRWRLLLNVIDGLPSNSHYVAALADDDELAENSPPPKARPPRLTEFSPEAAAIIDRLGDVITAVIAAAGGTPPSIEPYPRPVTAAERMKQRSRWRAHEDLVARLLPHKRRTS